MSFFCGQFRRALRPFALGRARALPWQDFKGPAPASDARPRGLERAGWRGAAALGLALSGSGHFRAEEEEGEDLGGAPRDVDEMGYRHTVVRGRAQPPFVDSACLRELQRDFGLRGSDIVIATFPKCGTTWVQQIVLTLLHGGDRSKVTHPILQAPWIEAAVNFKRLKMSMMSMARPMSVQELSVWDGEFGPIPAPPRRVFKTHAPVDLVPWRGGLAGIGGAKVIVVTRNPKDTCVSLFHHARDGGFKYRGDFHHFVTALFLRGKVESGCFWEWHAGWERAAEDHPGTVMWISYEELKRDFVGVVHRLGQFLDVPVPEELIAKAQEASSLQAMKEQFAKTDAEFLARSIETKKNHIRKGDMGSWRDDIQGALLNEFDTVHSAKVALSGLKYKFDFGDP